MKCKIIFYLCFSFFIVGCTSQSELRMKAERIRASLPEVKPEPKSTITKNVEPKVILPSPGGVTPPMPLQGNLIQVGGRVGVLAKDILIDLDLEGDNVRQIMGIRDYMISHWHYIHDPALDKDTWRAADVTIQLSHKGKFPGDCDDFAILMASLAKQIGLKSRVVGAYSSLGGHAFAEFLLKNRNDLSNSILNSFDRFKDEQGIWVSLDWFEGSDHANYNIQREVIVEE